MKEYSVIYSIYFHSDNEKRNILNCSMILNTFQIKINDIIMNNYPEKLIKIK